MRNLTVGVIGTSTPTKKIEKLAEEVGYHLAGNGVDVICGGLGGVMEAVCKGAKLNDGRTIGILPGSTPDDANIWVDNIICTGLGEARNLIIIKSSDAVIAIGGGYGTLSEIGFSLKLNKPIIGLHTWGLEHPNMDELALKTSDDPKEAVLDAIHLAKSRYEVSD